MHMHGSHRVHGELVDRYETTTIPSQLFSAFSSLPDSMSPTLFVSTTVATSADDELLKLTVPALFRPRLTCFSFPWQQLRHHFLTVASATL